MHRKNPACAGCHAPMDPLGFALEHFDAIGRWRTVGESSEPIDASGLRTVIHRSLHVTVYGRVLM